MSRQSIESMVSGLAAMRDRLSQQSFAREQVGRLHTAGEALARIAQSRSTDTAEQRAKRISDGAERYLQSISKTKADIQTRELAGLQSLHNQFAERVGLSTDGYRWANNVLDTFRNASQSDRTAMLAQIVESGDGRSLATLLEAPAFTHGVPRDMLDQYRDTMEQKFCPDVAEKRELFKEDVSAAEHALSEAERIAQAALEIEDVDSALQQAEETRQAEAQLEAATS